MMGMVDINGTIISKGWNSSKINDCKQALGEIKLGENICPDGSAIYYTESMHPIMPLFAVFVFSLGMLFGWYLHRSTTNIRAITKKKGLK
jgi:hypothetical protein